MKRSNPMKRSNIPAAIVMLLMLAITVYFLYRGMAEHPFALASPSP